MRGLRLAVRNRFQDIAVSSIIQTKFKVRKHYDLEKLGELSNSVATTGMLQPVVVQPKGDKFELIIGSLTNAKSIPACIIGEVEDRRAIIMALIENLQRTDLTPFEDAWAFLKLIKDYEMSMKEIAVELGCSESLIRNRIKLLGASREVQAMIVRKEIPLGHVEPILSASSKGEQNRLAKTAAKHELSERDLVTLIQEQGGRKRRGRRGKPMDAKRVELKVRDFTHFMQDSMPHVIDAAGPSLRSMKSALKRLARDVGKYLLAIREEA